MLNSPPIVKKMFPLRPDRQNKNIPAGPLSIPWEIAEKAYSEYARRHGTGQSLQRLGERGGFGWSEMDTFYPAWRAEVDILNVLRKENEELKQKLERYVVNVRACLDTVPPEYSIAYREGGGPEDDLASLALTIHKLIDMVK